MADILHQENRHKVPFDCKVSLYCVSLPPNSDVAASYATCSAKSQAPSEIAHTSTHAYRNKECVHTRLHAVTVRRKRNIVQQGKKNLLCFPTDRNLQNKVVNVPTDPTFQF